MVILIVIGWAVVLPVSVVLGLYWASNVLSRHARIRIAADATALAREFVGVGATTDRRPLAGAEGGRDAVRRPVGAGY